MEDKEEFEDIHRGIQTYLDDNGWSEATCECGREFYYKRGRDGSCQHQSCVNGFTFQDAGETNDFRGADTIALELFSEIADIGINCSSPTSVKNQSGTTFLTSAAVQILDSIMFDEEPYEPDTSQFVAQPVVRTNAANVVGKNEGFSTSFINVATVAVEPESSTVVDHLDMWFEMLSSLGLLVSNFALSTEVVRGNDWGQGPFPDYILSLSYGGLTIGEIIVHGSFPQGSRSPIDILDAGFGLERIAWAANRTSRYFDAIGPIRASIHQPIPFIDAVRTLTLLAGEGIEPGQEGAGYRYRQITKQLLKHSSTPDFEGLIPYYRQFWSRFCDISDAETIRKRIRNEFDRNYNRQFRDLSNTPDIDTDTERYLRELACRGHSLSDVKKQGTDETSTSTDKKL